MKGSFGLQASTGALQRHIGALALAGTPTAPEADLCRLLSLAASRYLHFAQDALRPFVEEALQLILHPPLLLKTDQLKVQQGLIVRCRSSLHKFEHYTHKR